MKAMLAVVLIALGCPFVGAPNAQPAADAEQPGEYAMRFGVNGGMYPPIRQAGEARFLAISREMDRLGMVWQRHVGRGQSWFEMQPTRDTWDFRSVDAVVAQNSHPIVLNVWGQVGFVYPFKSELPWARLGTLGNKTAIMNHIKAHQADLSDPQQKAEAEVYVKTFVERFKDVVDYWEIGNEGLRTPEALDIAVHTHRWIKEAKPDATVLLGTVAGDDDTTFARGSAAYRALLAQGIGECCDVATMHYYGRTEGIDVTLAERVRGFRAALDEFGVDKPLWLTETSTSSHESSVLSGPSSERSQARDVVKRLVVASAAGADKVFWHDYRETHPDNKFYGCNLVDQGRGPKPAYFTLKLVVDELGYYETVEELSADGVKLYRFTADAGDVFVTWSDSEQTIDLSPHLTSTQVTITHIVEEAGETPATETAPVAHVPVSPSPAFVSGG